MASTAVTTDSEVDRWTVIRQDGMKLISFDDESQELYNLNTDPSENTPLSLSNPTNLAIAQELESYAIADDVGRGSVQYRTWSGPNGGVLQTASNWDSPTGPIAIGQQSSTIPAHRRRLPMS